MLCFSLLGQLPWLAEYIQTLKALFKRTTILVALHFVMGKKQLFHTSEENDI